MSLIGLFLMAYSGTDFAFKRLQMLLSLHEKSWIEHERSINWLLLARFLIACVLILTYTFWLQVLIVATLLALEVLAGRLYLPKIKRESE
jgi:hypothetical protein